MKIHSARKFLFALTAVFLLASFFIVLFHHHEEGQHGFDCPLCRLAREIVCACLLFLGAFIILVLKSRKFFGVPSRSFVSLLLPQERFGRAPPILS